MKRTWCNAVLLACWIAGSLVGVAKAEDPEVANTPNWYLSVEALALNRSTPQGGAIVSSNPGGVPFMSASDLDFGMSPGVDATIGYNGSAFGSLEGRVIYSKFEGTDSFVSPGAFIGVGFTGPGGTTFDSDFSTTFASVEVNWRHSLNDRLSLLVGLRALDVSDSLSTTLNSGVATGVYDAENRLLGAQIGAEVSFLDASSPFQLSLDGKVGAYANRSSAGIDEFQGPNFIGGFASGNVTKTSFAAEIGLTAGYSLSENLMLTGGYRAIWVDDLALASNAASGSQLNPSLLNNTIFRDDLLLHGATLGLLLSF